MKRGRSKSAPKYRLHKATGQARVTINGKTYYLGKYDSPESQQRYRQVLSDHWATPDAPKRSELDSPITITLLAVEFSKFAMRRYGVDSSEWKYQMQPVIKDFRATFGHLAPHEFGPKRFEDYRQTLVAKGLCRDVVKRKSRYIMKMFQHGVKFELIPVELWQRLLAAGRVEMQLKTKRKRGAVDLKIIKATQKELTEVLSDMVEVHRLIGARPSEVCNIRPCDIDRSGDVWVYVPPSHKTEHLGHSRRIIIGPKAQSILTRYLLRDSQAFCFSPAESFKQHCELKHSRRKTPMNEGNKPKAKMQRSFRPKFDKDSYRRAIDRATNRAFPMRNDIKESETKADEWRGMYFWKPNQLRKSAATKARREMDLETAQILLGHASKKTTERFYAEVDNERAIEFARKHG